MKPGHKQDTVLGTVSPVKYSGGQNTLSSRPPGAKHLSDTYLAINVKSFAMVFSLFCSLLLGRALWNGNLFLSLSLLNNLEWCACCLMKKGHIPLYGFKLWSQMNFPVSTYSFSCILGCGQTRILADPQTSCVFSCLCAVAHMVPFTPPTCTQMSSSFILLANVYILICHLFNDLSNVIQCVSIAFCLSFKHNLW